MKQKYLYVVVFISGMCVLALELSASRLLGKAFGTGNVVWASVIGLTLLFLTFGYFLGGWLADRAPTYKAFYSVLSWGAFAGGLIPVLAALTLEPLADAVLPLESAVLVGTLIMMTLLLAIPITLLGTVSPYAVRLAIDDEAEAGRVAGSLYALSTVGSIIGSFLPVIVLIPAFGTNLTIFVCAGVLLAAALIGLAMTESRRAVTMLWMPLVIVILGIVIV